MSGENTKDLNIVMAAPIAELCFMGHAERDKTKKGFGLLGCTAYSFRRLYQGDLKLSCHESRSVKTSWGTPEEGIARPKTNNVINRGLPVGNLK